MTIGTLRVEAASSVDAKAWNAFILQHVRQNPIFAVAEWADYFTRWTPARPQFISIRNPSGDQIAAWLAFLLPLSTLRRGVKRLACLGMPYARELVWHAAPVVAHPARGSEVDLALTAWAGSYARTCGVLRIYGGPWIDAAPGTWENTPWGTYVIGCAGLSEDSQWTRLKSSARKAVRRARDAGVRVRRVLDRSELPDYYRYVEGVARKTGRRLNGLTELQAGWDFLRPSGRFELFVAEQGTTWTGVLGVRGYGDYISEVGLYQSSADRTERLHSQDLIKWEVMRWASGEGVRSYDLAGVHPSPQSDKDLGIHRFKEKWGGAYLEYPTVRSRWITRWSVAA